MKFRLNHSSLLQDLTLGCLAAPLWFAGSAPAQAASILCPSIVTTQAPYGTASLSGFQLQNGLCTNDAAGFSGAALASQAISDLSQTTTQETNRTTLNSVSNRREQEEQRCAEGFSRVDGVCERNKPRTSEAETSAPLPPAAPAPSKPKKKTLKKTKRETPSLAAPAAVYKPVFKGPPAPPPIAIEPAARFGVWTQVYGDYESRNASGFASQYSVVGSTQVPLEVNVQSRSGTVGFQAGGDFTTRGVFSPNDGVIAGLMAGYLSTNLTLTTTSVSANQALAGNGSTRMTARLEGPSTGVYATYFKGPFSADFLAKADIMTLSEWWSQNISYVPGPADVALGITSPFNYGDHVADPVSLVNVTLAGNLNYRFDLSPVNFIEPTVGTQFTRSLYGTGADRLGLSDGSLVMIQGGARVGTIVPLSNNILMKATLTGLAYDDVLVSGGFIPGAAYFGNNLLAQADQGHVRGRGILAFNFDFGQGFSSFIQGEVRGGAGLFGAGGKAGIRYEW